MIHGDVRVIGIERYESGRFGQNVVMVTAESTVVDHGIAEIKMIQTGSQPKVGDILHVWVRHEHEAYAEVVEKEPF